MKGSRHNRKVWIIIVIILVFAVGIGAGIVTGTMMVKKETKNTDKTTSVNESKNAGNKKDEINSGTGDSTENDKPDSGETTGGDDKKNNSQDDAQNPSQDDSVTDNSGSTYDASIPGDDTGIHRYEYILSDGTWQEAFQDCIDRGGYLVRINSSSEYEYIRKEISRQKMTNIFFHIGGRRDSGSSDYYWVNEDNKLFGEKLNSDDSWCSDEWKKGEPSYKDGSLEELYMDLFFFDGEKRFVWNDIPDNMLAAEPAYSGKLGYICEYEN